MGKSFYDFPFHKIVVVKAAKGGKEPWERLTCKWNVLLSEITVGAFHCWAAPYSIPEKPILRLQHFKDQKVFGEGKIHIKSHQNSLASFLRIVRNVVDIGTLWQCNRISFEVLLRANAAFQVSRRSLKVNRIQKKPPTLQRFKREKRGIKTALLYWFFIKCITFPVTTSDFPTQN